MKSMLKNQQFLALILIVVGVAFRWLPHLPNMAPIAAIALIGSMYLSKRLALVVPVLAMLISDSVLGFYGKEMLLVYGCFVITGLLGLWVRQTRAKKRLLSVTLLSSVIFYVVTNFGVWLWGTMYAHSWSGLMECYIAALPFFRNTVIGDLFYTFVLFGLYSFVIKLVNNSASVSKYELHQGFTN